MKRHYYISEDLDDLTHIEQELEDNGIETPQIHILSQNDADVENHHLHEVEAVLKKDVVHSMEIGAILGLVGATIILGTAYFAGWMESAAGPTPFIFLAVVVFGFCTWEGGLFGIQEPHYQFKQFQEVLDQGKHIFFVDIRDDQEPILSRIIEAHPRLKLAGLAEATPTLVIEAQKKWKGITETLP